MDIMLLLFSLGKAFIYMDIMILLFSLGKVFCLYGHCFKFAV